MTDNEIRKALERCSTNYNCGDCPYYYDNKDCPDTLMNDALDLINRQKAEIERLNIRNKALIDITKNYDWKFARAKSEAIKEFAHFVIDRSRNGVIQISYIPDLVKEMMEVNENDRA